MLMLHAYTQCIDRSMDIFTPFFYSSTPFTTTQPNTIGSSVNLTAAFIVIDLFHFYAISNSPLVFLSWYSYFATASFFFSLLPSTLYHLASPFIDFASRLL
ncbi:hypothetical protein BDF19DRAFT_51433 [Syncephalis fuscata]|nr:hypothetical protein BDF19DRAFT_51433 [Syncephalis fuscata]